MATKQLTFEDVQAEKRRFSRQQTELIERLKRGPATNAELIRIAQRFGARFHELRKRGYRIEEKHRDHKTGLVTYELLA